MKKLVSLALVLALVFCVGCAFAAEKNLPKQDGVTAAYNAKLAEDEAEFNGARYPFNATTTVATLGTGRFLWGSDACDVRTTCRHILTVDPDKIDVIEDLVDGEHVKKVGATYVYDHLVTPGHDWQPTVRPTNKADAKNVDYEQLDKEYHLWFPLQECTQCLKTKRFDKDTGDKEKHNFEWYPVSDKLLPCTEVVDLYEMCKDCGYKSGNTTQSQPGKHKWDGVEMLNYVEPNCVTKEAWDYHCTVCGTLTTWTDGKVDSNVHNYGDIVPVKKATCTKPGVGYQLCWWCRDSILEDQPIKPLGHAFDNGTYTYEDRKPTCYKTGIKTYKCTRDNCDGIGDVTAAYGYPQAAIDAGKIIAPTPAYDEKGEFAYFWLQTDKLAHTFDNKHYVPAYEPSCEFNGGVWYVCVNKDCQKYYTELYGEGEGVDVLDIKWFPGDNDEYRTLKPTGHSFVLDKDLSTAAKDQCEGVYYDGSWEAWYVCENDGCDVDWSDGKIDGMDPNAWYWGQLDDGTAYYVLRMDALGHTWSEWVKQNDYEAGSTLGYWLRECVRCKKQDRIIAEDPTKNIIVTEVVKEPTCTEPGMVKVTEYDQRDTEKKSPINVTTEEIPAKGHSLTIDVPAVEATHTKPAISAGKKCDRCDYVEGAEEVEGSIKNGLCNGEDGDQTGAKEGEFVYFEGGVASATKTGLVDFEGGKFFVKNGKIDTSLNGVDGGEKLGLDLDFYWFNDGQVADYSGLATYTGTKGSGWFVVDNGKVDLTYMGLYTYAGQRFVISYGQWAEKYNGFYWTDNEIVFVEDGMVSTSSGLVNYDGAIFLIEKGVLAENFTGEYADHNGKIFNVVNGMVQ